MAAPVRFDEIRGQPAAIALLERAIEAGRLPHALLFHGPDGIAGELECVPETHHRLGLAPPVELAVDHHAILPGVGEGA